MNRRLLLAGCAVVGVAAFVAIALRPPSESTATVEPQHWDSLPRDVDVEVLNASGVSGAARRTAFTLRTGLLDVVWYGDADSVWRGRARSAVVVRRRDTTGVGRVKELLGDIDVIDRFDESRVVDLSVIVGKDYSANRSRP